MTQEVSFLDMKAHLATHREDLLQAAANVLDSGWLVLGRETATFEQEYADYCGTKHCVGVANGLDALSLALRALDIGPSDEVIVPANTYIATWLAVSHVGATPVPVEPVEATYNMDPALIEAAITPRTRAILPVHLYGQAADIPAIKAIAERHGLAILEDGAQAHGAEYHGVRIGTGDSLVAWSFYPGKNLGAIGDGGGVTTGDPAIADRLAMLRNYGSRVKYHNDVIGYNSRLDELQAAMLRVKLRALDAENARRKEIAARYLDGLRGANVILPTVPDWADPVWHLFVVRHADRDGLAARLKADGIATMIHYPVPPHLQPAYRDAGYAEGSLPLTERIHREVLSLPIFPELAAAEQQFVVEGICQFFAAEQASAA